METVQYINSIVHDFIWGRGMLAVFLFVGLLFTVGTGFFQLRKWRLWIGDTLGKVWRERHQKQEQDPYSISPFQSFCTALAATLGTGNITGVATALVVGGPGAIFWMWISALVGMMTMYAENVLGSKYRYRDKSGRWIGGAMVYMERGLGAKWLAIIFAVCCILSSFGMGNMTQANSMASGLKEAFEIPTSATAVVLMITAGLVLFGGIKRIAAVAEKVIPFVAGMYMLGGAVVLCMHAAEIPNAFSTIFSEAFSLSAVGGGALGYGMKKAMQMGIARGVFSNEAGLGSSVMAHVASDVKEPAVQGMWAMLEVFIDTIVVCTMTALVILTSGVYDKQVCLSNIMNNIENIDGTTLTGKAFATVIPAGDKFLAIAIVLFAFATIISWAYFGERTFAYVFGEQHAITYKILYIFILFPGCVTAPALVWEVADTFNGMMAIPNLTALILLSGEVFMITRRYMKEKKKFIKKL